MTPPLKRLCVAVTACLLATALPLPAEEDDGSIEGLVQQAREWLEENPPGEIAATDFPTTEDWQSFWSDAQTALHSGTVEDLAWIRPEIEAALGYLVAVPGGRNYADWLRQRLDYFQVAEEAIRDKPSIPLRPPPAAKPPMAPRSIVPPRRSTPPAPAPPVPVESRMRAAVRSPAMWSHRLAGRPRPAGADAIVPDLKKAFAAEGVPPELVWLAEVESSMNPEARSPSGAVGLFQLMPDTARGLGLRTRFGDERRSPQKSARAAARYLRQLHQRFGSWPLAIAAYNAGEGCLSQAMKKDRNASFEEIAPALPLETQMYVPKVMATVALREGVDPAKLPPPSLPRTGE